MSIKTFVEFLQDKGDLGHQILTEKNWIQGAINPAHKGFCTPETKKTCTPRRKALAHTLRKMHKKKDD